MRNEVLPLLACPACHGDLAFEGLTDEKRIIEGTVTCAACQRSFPVVDEIPALVEEALSAGEWRWEVDVSDLEQYDAIGAAYAASLPPEVRAAGERIVARLSDRASAAVGPVLDISTGRGGLLRPLVQSLPQDRLAVGSDVDQSVLRGTQAAMRRDDIYHAASLLVSDGKHLALKAGVTDCIVSHFGFSNIPQAGLALAEAARVLTSGGSVVFSTLLGREGSDAVIEAEKAGHADLMTPIRIERTLALAGLSLVSLEEFVSGTWPGNPYDRRPLAGDWFAHAVVVAEKPG